MFVESVTEFDFAILDYIQENLRCAFLDWFMPFLSALGEAGIVWIVIAVALLLFKKTRACGAAVIVSVLLTLLIGEYGIKNIVCRVRPCNVNLGIDMLVSRPKSYSFPSGHTGAAFSAAVAIFCRYKKAGVVAVIFALLVGFSRMYNYVHFPTDVLAGMIFGTIMAIIVYVSFKKLHVNDKINRLGSRKR